MAENLASKAKDVLGTTSDINEAGFMLADGTLTRHRTEHDVEAEKVIEGIAHDMEDFFDKNSLESSEDDEAIAYAGHLNKLYNHFINNTGAIRITGGHGKYTIDTATSVPTPDQIKSLKIYFENVPASHITLEGYHSSPLRRALRLYK